MTTLSIDSVPADFVMTYEDGPQTTPDQVTASLTPIECTYPISLTSFVARKFGVTDSPTFFNFGTSPPQPINISPTLPTQAGIYDIEMVAEVDDGTGVTLTTTSSSFKITITVCEGAVFKNFPHAIRYEVGTTLIKTS